MSERIELAPRPDEATVSVVVMSYNQGPFVAEAVASAVAQDHPAVEVLVADHASTDQWSREAARDAAAAHGLRFVELEPQRTVGQARNLAIAEAAGNYVLPLDADNLLLPDAASSLAAQLDAAQPEVAFVYPRLLCFVADDEWEAEVPDWNLFALMLSNFCDTGGLWDRRCFDPGPGFPAVPRHEDWGLALALAELGLRGERAVRPSVRLRRHGFTRSMAARGDDSRQRLDPIVASAPSLYDPERFAELKRRWAPAVSILAVGDAAELGTLSEGQVCRDFEIVALPGSHPADWLSEALARARGSVVLAAGEAAADLLRRPELVELLARAFTASDRPPAVVIELGDHYPWQPLSVLDGGVPAAVAFRAGEVPPELRVVSVSASAVDALAAAALECTGVELRGWPGHSPEAAPGRGTLRTVIMPVPSGDGAREELRRRTAMAPLVSGAPTGVDAMTGASPSNAWAPPGTISVIRAFEPDGRTSVRFNEAARPAQGELGWARREPAPGTIPVRHTAGGLVERADTAQEAVGHLEAEDVTGLDELLEVDDPLLGRAVMSSAENLAARGAVVRGSIGFVEPPRPHPTARRRVPCLADRCLLVRGVSSRGHSYGLGEQPVGADLELGRALARPGAATVALTDVVGTPKRLDPVALIRWTLAPLRWTGWGAVRDRARVLRWRLTWLRAPNRLRVAAPRLDGVHLWGEMADGRSPLYVAWHAATADCLLCLEPRQAAAWGYGRPRLVGFVETVGGDRLGDVHRARPWCSREGRAGTR